MTNVNLTIKSVQEKRFSELTCGQYFIFKDDLNYSQIPICIKNDEGKNYTVLSECNQGQFLSHLGNSIVVPIENIELKVLD